MIAAHLLLHHPPQAKLLVIDALGRSLIFLVLRSLISCGPAIWWSPTTPPPCPRASRVSTCPRAAVSRCGSPVAGRSRRMMSGSLPPSCSARATTARAPRTVRRRRARTGRSNLARPSRGDCRASPPLATFRVVAIRGYARRHLVRSGATRPADPVRATYRWRSPCGTCGRRSRAAGRVRAAVGRVCVWIGMHSRPCAAAGSRSPPSRTRLESRRPATTNWTDACRLMSLTTFRRLLLPRSAGHRAGRTSRCDRNHRRACSGARGERRRPGASRQRTGDAANRGCDRLGRRTRSHRHTRAGHQSLRVAACVHRRCDPRQGVPRMTSARLSLARIRRLGSDRAKVDIRRAGKPG